MLVTRAFLYIIFRVPFQVHRLRDALFPEPSFNHLSEFPVKVTPPPASISTGLGLVWREGPASRAFVHT
jgi:hypothetical protein